MIIVYYIICIVVSGNIVAGLAYSFMRKSRTSSTTRMTATAT